MNIQQLEELMKMYANRSLTDAQRLELILWLEKKDTVTEEELAAVIGQQMTLADVDLPADWMKSVERIVSTDRIARDTFEMQVPFIQGRPKRRTLWYSLAAGIAALLITGVFYLNLKPDNNSVVVAEEKRKEAVITPGRDGAILILSDGAELILDNLDNGDISTQNGSRVVLQSGQLSYHPDGKATANIVYNTMTTPKGRQFSLLLPDGSRVWLNAASSLKYPTAFSGNERRVEVMGEAYFEIAQNARLPFRVDIAGKGELEVLGTSFNVNAYEDQGRIDMTLIEGSVKVLAQRMDKKTGTERAVVLHPGQQAQLMPGQQTTTAIKVIENADMDKVMAWKNGLFNFNGLTFQEIMQQLERWYDIKVVYENNIPPNKRLAGEMTRGVSLDGLLKQFGEMGVRYKLTGRTLLVLH